MSAPTATASDTHEHAPQTASAPMLGVFLQVSVAFALVLLVRDLLALAPLDRALLTSAGAGVVLYGALVGGFFVVRHILQAPPEVSGPEATAEAPAPAAAAEPSPESPAEAVAA